MKQFWWDGMSGFVCLAIIVAIVIVHILLYRSFG